MASSKERQRKLARARYERQMARKAASARKSRQIQAGVAAGLAVLLIALGSIWLFGGFESDPEPAASEDRCAWTAAQGENLKDVGTPPTKDIPVEGTRPMTITTNTGAIQVGLDLTNSPCAAASFTHLAGKNFFDNTKCSELTTEGALRCGDPGDSGLGGPTYTLFGENVPAAPEPDPTPTGSAAPTPSPSPKATPPVTYPRGTVALIAATPGTNGSQFLIFHKDFTTAQASHSIVGRVTGGLDVLDKIVKAGTVDNGSGEKVKPKNDVVIQSLTVGEVVPPAGATPPPPPAWTPTGAPAGAPTPSPTAQS